MAGLRVTGHGLDLGTALRGRVEDRMAATLSKYLDPHMSGSCTGHVTLRRDGTAYRTDCVLHLVTGLTLEASGAAHDVHASFEQTADKLEKRLRRYKHKLKTHSAPNHNGADIEAAYHQDVIDQNNHKRAVWVGVNGRQRRTKRTDVFRYSAAPATVR